MTDTKQNQSLAVFAKARADLLASGTEGKLDRVALRAALPGMTDRQFGLAFHEFRKRLFEDTGRCLTPIPKSGGKYRLDTAEEGIDRAFNTKRRKVVEAAERHLDSLRFVQRRDDLTDDTLNRAQREEVIASRDTAFVRRAYLRREVKRPPGLEEK